MLQKMEGEHPNSMKRERLHVIRFVRFSTLHTVFEEGFYRRQSDLALVTTEDRHVLIQFLFSALI